MASAVDAVGNPSPTLSVLTASMKHIGIRCMLENVEFLKCKKDSNPKKCLDKGKEVTCCVLGLWLGTEKKAGLSSVMTTTIEKC